MSSGVPIRFVAVVLGTRGSRVPGVAAFIRMGLANEFAALLPRLGRGAADRCTSSRLPKIGRFGNAL